MESANSAVVLSTYHKSLDENGSHFVRKFCTHGFSNFYILFDNKLNHTLEDLQKAYGEVNVCFYGDEDFKKHKFDRPIDRHHHWGSHQNPNYFYAHFRMLIFWLNNPTYEYYWFFDDDVTFSGDLKGLLSLHDKENFDFLAIQAFKKQDYNLPFVSQVNQRMGSRGNWLSFAPGPGDKYQTCEKHLGSFFPIVRFSNKAMKHLYELNHQDFFGYSEGFVPTTIASTPGLTVGSMLDEYDQYFLKNNIQCEIKHKGSEFTWTWI